VTEAVLDSSALLALLFDEPGADRVATVLPDAVISAINLAEAATKLQDRGLDEATARAAVAATGVRIAPFSEDLAWIAASLRASTRDAGLSLGERACVALAIDRGARAYTADHAWARTGVKGIVLIR
jgi:PIN domain nuclease of toxin-antitoxin system